MRLQGKKVAVLVEDGFEDLEFWVPVLRLREEGAHVVVVGTGRMDLFHGKNSLTAKPDVSAENVHAGEFDAVVIPGGWAPDKLRRFEAIKRLVRETYEQKKIVAAICHAGWVPISAGIVKGHRATGSRAIRDDLENAGAEWVDEGAFRDRNLVWGRVVDDLPAFCRELVDAIETNKPKGR
jgi:protease I